MLSISLHFFQLFKIFFLRSCITLCMKIIIRTNLIIGLTLISNLILGQNRIHKSYWSYNIHLTSTHFLSDLGGKNTRGSNDISDLDFSSTRYGLGTGLQYNTPSGLSIGFDLMEARLYGDDSETNSDRRYRNLHSRTDIFETTTNIKYTHLKNGFYFSVGAGFCFFRPMAKLNNKWYELRSLNTEGQGIDPEKNTYEKYTPVIPFCIGKKFHLDNRMSIAIDLSLRKAFSDYLDDVSTTYFDKQLIRNQTGDIAAELSNRSFGDTGIGQTGSKRGNPENNDNYFFVGIKLFLPIDKTNNFHKRHYRMRKDKCPNKW